jgi:4-hydroxyphenylpyruvate dioxygenase
VAFEVEDCANIYRVAVSRGAVGVQEPTVVEDLKGNGSVLIATIKTYGDTRHSFIQRDKFTGTFLPNFDPVQPDVITGILGELNFSHIDHIVANHLSIESTVEFYEKILSFHKYWSIDDTLLNTKYSYNTNYKLIEL